MAVKGKFMAKRAKLTLESDPVENEPARPDDGVSVSPSGNAETVTTAPGALAKKPGVLKTVFVVGLTIASIVIFKRKIF